MVVFWLNWLRNDKKVVDSQIKKEYYIVKLAVN